MKTLYAILGAAVAAAAAAVAGADEVVLENGDRLTGSDCRIQGETLTITTPWGGKVSLDTGGVSKVLFAEPVPVLYVDGGEFETTELLAADSPFSRLKSANPAPVNPWSLSLALGYGLADGNSNQSDFNGALDAGYLVEDISRFTLGARYAYGNEKKEGESRRDTTDNGQAWLQADVFIFDFSYAYARSQAGFDRMKDLTRRLENGVGLGYDLLQSEHGYAGVEAGAGYIDSRYDGSPDQHGVHLRLAQNGNYDLSSLLAVNETVSYQPKVSEFSHYLLDAELALKFTVAGNLYLGLILSDRYDSSPPEDKKNNDIGISAALGYSL